MKLNRKGQKHLHMVNLYFGEGCTFGHTCSNQGKGCFLGYDCKLV